MGKGAKTAAQRPKTPSHLRSAPKGYANDPDAVARYEEKKRLRAARKRKKKSK